MTSVAIKRATVTPGGQKHVDILADRGPGIRVATGGYGSLKTSLGCAFVLDVGFRWAHLNAPVLGCEPTYPMVRDVMERSFMETCDRFGIPFRHWQSDHIFEVGRRRRFEFWCRSLDKPKSCEGINAMALWVDEWEMCKARALVPALQRVRVVDLAHKARTGLEEPMEKFLTGTAEGFNEAYNLVLKKPASTTRQYILRTVDNPFVSQAYIDDSKALLDETEQAEKLDGIRQSKGGLVYRRFDRAANFGRCVGEREACAVELWCDFNVGAQCWFIVEHVKDERGHRFHIAQEVIGYDVDTDQQCVRALSALAEFLTRRNGRRVEPEDVKRMRIAAPCDASGRNRGVVASHASVLTSHGFRPLYPTSNPDVEDRVFSLNLAFAKRPLALTIDEKRCPFLASAITQQGRDNAGAPKKDKDPRKDLSGPNDAIGYGVWWWAPTYRYRPNVAEQPQAKRPTFDDDVLR